MEPVVDPAGSPTRAIAWMMPDGSDPERSGGVFLRRPDGTAEAFADYDAMVAATADTRVADRWQYVHVSERTEA